MEISPALILLLTNLIAFGLLLLSQNSKKFKKYLKISILLIDAILVTFTIFNSLETSENNILGENTNTIVTETNIKDATFNEVNNSYEVVEVIDGDTIKINYNGEPENVRLIGIDAPEFKHFNNNKECFADESKQYLEDLLKEGYVKLEIDETQGNTDRYERLLRYIIIGDNNNVNKELLLKGYAFEYTYREGYKYQTEFKEAQETAKMNSLGLWNTSNCNGNRE